MSFFSTIFNLVFVNIYLEPTPLFATTGSWGMEEDLPFSALDTLFLLIRSSGWFLFTFLVTKTNGQAFKFQNYR